jgi:NADH-quinone oxidoreductase subunit H
MTFAMFFLAEYSHIILMSLITSLLFFGGWLPIMDIAPFNWIPGYVWLSLKTTFFTFVFVWIRGTFPRMRYDQLMALLWKSYLPFSLGYLILVVSILYGFNGIPNF